MRAHARVAHNATGTELAPGASLTISASATLTIVACDVSHRATSVSSAAYAGLGPVAVSLASGAYVLPASPVLSAPGAAGVCYSTQAGVVPACGVGGTSCLFGTYAAPGAAVTVSSAATLAACACDPLGQVRLSCVFWGPNNSFFFFFLSFLLC